MLSGTREKNDDLQDVPQASVQVLLHQSRQMLVQASVQVSVQASVQASVQESVQEWAVGLQIGENMLL